MESYYSDYFQGSKKPAEPPQDPNDRDSEENQQRTSGQQEPSRHSEQYSQEQPGSQPQAKGPPPPQQSKTYSAAPLVNAGGGNCKIYVTNLHASTDEKDLAEAFTHFGDIVQIIHKGQYAFIEFSEPQLAEEAVRAMAGHKSGMTVQMAFNRNSTLNNPPSNNQQSAPQSSGGPPPSSNRFENSYGGDMGNAGMTQAPRGGGGQGQFNSRGGYSGGQGGGGGSKGGDTCYKCSQTGHWASQCPSGGGGGQRGGGSYGNSGGYNGGGRGGGGGGESSAQCYNCNETGHYSRSCPQPKQQRGGGGGGYGGRGGGGYRGGF